MAKDAPKKAADGKDKKALTDAEKAEIAEIEKLKKEKLRKAKLREKKAKVQQKKEIKRIKATINFPIKLHFNITMLVTLFSFIFFYFVLELEIGPTLLLLFTVFTFMYLIVGGIGVAVFYMISRDKEQELREQLRMEVEHRINEERRLEREELERLEEIERDIAAKRLVDTNGNKSDPALIEETARSLGGEATIDEEGNVVMPMLGEASESIEDIFDAPTSSTDAMEDAFINAQMQMDHEAEAGNLVNGEIENDYAEIFDPNFKP